MVCHPNEETAVIQANGTATEFREDVTISKSLKANVFSVLASKDCWWSLLLDMTLALIGRHLRP